MEETHPAEPELLRLRDGLPDVIETDDALATYAAGLAAGEGPVAIDAERASGYRYSNRAYLVQVRRTGTVTALIDPIAFDSLAPLNDAIGDAEWILHAATQDLPCLAEIGLRPVALFDTELAGRLLNYPRVGLATLVETLLGYRMLKEHSAVDWSTRPLPDSWREYAALDVEVLVELREVLIGQLEEAGKLDWARQEFDALRGFTPPERTEGWRRTSGMHKVRGRRSLAAVRELWLARDAIARERDVTPGRLIPDSAISAAAKSIPTSRSTLMRTEGFHGRGASKFASTWVDALRRAAALPEDELPSRAPRGDGPPAPRAWAEKDPIAARRLEAARAGVAAVAAAHDLPTENLLTPDHLRRVMWQPPRTREPVALLEGIIDRLRHLGSRDWQIALTAPVLARAVIAADEAPEAAAPVEPDEPGQEEPAPGEESDGEEPDGEEPDGSSVPGEDGDGS